MKKIILKEPVDMTPGERLDQIVALMSKGVVQSMKPEKANDQVQTKNSNKVLPIEPIPIHKILPEIPRIGRIPFGEIKEEAIWINRIIGLNAQSLSSEKIAKTLNREDHSSIRSGKWTRTAVWRILKRNRSRSVTD